MREGILDPGEEELEAGPFSIRVRLIAGLVDFFLSRFHLHQLILLRPEPELFRLIDLDSHRPGIEPGQNIVPGFQLHVFRSRLGKGEGCSQHVQ